jgi:hypothetical protein
MAYDIHITRAADWSGSRTQPIRLDEWYSLIENSPEMRLEEVATATNPTTGEVIGLDTPGRAVWLSHPRGIAVSFDYRNGKISVKSPDHESLEKMKQIAATFGAHVQGDDGEEYD